MPPKHQNNSAPNAAAPSMQDVAKIAGVHQTTVSLALRHHPRIPIETRTRIEAVAQKLGYRIHPFVSTLMQARRAMRPVKDVATLGWITAWPTRHGWRAPENPIPDFMPGAIVRAAELGYRIEDFWLTEPGMTPHRMNNILRARNISGLIVGRLPPGLRVLDLEWNPFAAVSIGVSLESPRLSHVAENHFHTGKLAFQSCAALGYRRLGLALPQQLYARVQERFLGGFLAEQHAHRSLARLPPLITEQPDEPAFRSWLKKNKPDVIICMNVEWALPWLKRLGLRVPEDIGVAGLAVERTDGSHAGVALAPGRIGAMAVDMLVGMLYRNERGLPAEEHEILYRQRWIQGATIRQQ